MKRIGVYPGTFDPITLGHMDIIERGAKLVDELIIGVTTNAAKSPMFNDAERIAMVEREVAAIGNAGNIRVVGFDSLLMDFAESQGAATVIRGIRGVTDFEYEYQLTGMNRQLNDRIETVFLMADVALQPIASGWSRKSLIMAATSPNSSPLTSAMKWSPVFSNWGARAAETPSNIADPFAQFGLQQFPDMTARHFINTIQRG